MQSGCGAAVRGLGGVRTDGKPTFHCCIFNLKNGPSRKERAKRTVLHPSSPSPRRRRKETTAQILHSNALSLSLSSLKVDAVPSWVREQVRSDKIIQVFLKFHGPVNRVSRVLLFGRSFPRVMNMSGENNVVDLWSEIAASEDGDGQHHHGPQLEVIYHRRKPQRANKENVAMQYVECLPIFLWKCLQGLRNVVGFIKNELLFYLFGCRKQCDNGVRVSFAANSKRVSWNRSLSTRLAEDLSLFLPL